MNISTRTDSNCAYITISYDDYEPIHKSYCENDNIICDYDKCNRLVGVELLCPVRISDVAQYLPPKLKDDIIAVIVKKLPEFVL